jgi:hypothetical protein
VLELADPARGHGLAAAERDAGLAGLARRGRHEDDADVALGEPVDGDAGEDRLVVRVGVDDDGRSCRHGCASKRV